MAEGEGEWACAECEYVNEAGDAACAACDAPKPAAAAAAAAGASRYDGYKAGLVLTCEPVAGKDKLKRLSVDVGGATPITLATNAPNVVEGSRIVVATVGAIVEGEPLKKATVGGVPSEGMVCSNPMLGWTGGGANTAALLPDSFKPGDAPPDKAPRLK
jgi:tRNA-binding EMAP/Myf-like protein